MWTALAFAVVGAIHLMPVAPVFVPETLSRLYGIEVDVLRVRGRVVVVGTPDAEHVHHVH